MTYTRCIFETIPRATRLSYPWGVALSLGSRIFGRFHDGEERRRERPALLCAFG